MRYASVFVMLWLTLAIPAGAAETYPLAALVERALSRSEWMAVLEARVEEKRMAAEQALAWQNPQLGIAVGRKQVSSLRGPTYEAAISQPFFYPGKQALRAQMLDLGAEGERVQVRQASLFISSEVVRLAYEYAANRRQAKFAVTRLQRFELIRGYLAGRLFASPQKKAESRVVEHRLRALTAEGLMAQSAQRASFANLNLYLEFQSEADVELALAWLTGERALDEGAWLAKAEEANPGLAAQRVSIAAAKKETELAAREVRPDFAVSAFYTEAANGETEQVVGGGLSLSLPLLNRFQKAVRSLEHKAQAEERLLRFQRRQLSSQLLQLFAEFEAARQTVRHYPDTVFDVLEQQITEAEAEFRKGRIDLLTFLELDDQIAETFHHALEVQVALSRTITALSLLGGQHDVLAQIASLGGVRR